MFRNIVQTIVPGKTGESELRKMVCELLRTHGGSVIQRFTSVAAGRNTMILGYQPTRTGRIIASHDSIFIEVAFRKELSYLSYLGEQMQTIKEKWEIDKINLLNVSKFRLLKEKISADDDLIAYIVDDQKLRIMQNFYNNEELTCYQAESYIVGDPKSNKIHEVVIDALCAALEALKDRANYSNYEQIDVRVRKIIEQHGLGKYGYWLKGHNIFMSDKKESLPLGYFLYSTSPQPLSGPIQEFQNIYLCPLVSGFVSNVRYGLSVIITKDGYLIH